jgi:hypothetical protein
MNVVFSHTPFLLVPGLISSPDISTLYLHLLSQHAFFLITSCLSFLKPTIFLSDRISFLIVLLLFRDSQITSLMFSSYCPSRSHHVQHGLVSSSQLALEILGGLMCISRFPDYKNISVFAIKQDCRKYADSLNSLWLALQILRVIYSLGSKRATSALRIWHNSYRAVSILHVFPNPCPQTQLIIPMRL